MVYRIRIGNRVLVIFVLCYVILASLVGWVVYKRFVHSLHDVTFTSLAALREVKKNQIEYYFTRLRIETLSIAQHPIARIAAGQLIAAYNSVKNELKPTPEQMAKYKEAVEKFYRTEFIKRLNAHVLEDKSAEAYIPVDETAIILQYFYIASNPNPIGSKSFLNMAHDGSVYSALHGKFQDSLKDLIKRFGFYDMYLIDPESGVITYSVYKDVDFATSLKTGPYRDSNLAQIYKACLAEPLKDVIKFVDFKQYDPALGTAVAFIGAPVFEGEKKIAIVVFQLRVFDINMFTTDNNRWDRLGLGRTGEIYVVGSDYKMRSISRPFVENQAQYLETVAKQGVPKNIIDQMKVNQTTVILQEVATDAVKGFLRGQTSNRIDTNYLNKQVLSTFTPMNIPEVTWGIIAEKHKEEVIQPAHTLFKFIGLAALLLLILLLIILYLIMHIMVLNPLNDINRQLQGAASKKAIIVSTMLPAPANDEIGQLAQSFNGLLRSVNQSISTIRQIYADIDLSLQRCVQGIQSIDSAEVIAQQLTTLDKSSNALVHEMRMLQTEAKQIQDIAHTVKTSVLNSSTPISYLTSFSKKMHERIATIREDLKDESNDETRNAKILNELNYWEHDVSTLNQMTDLLNQNIRLVSEQMRDAEKIARSADTVVMKSDDSQASVKAAINQVNLLFRKLKQELRDVNVSIKSMQKLNEELKKILSTFI